MSAHVERARVGADSALRDRDPIRVRRLAISLGALLVALAAACDGDHPLAPLPKVPETSYIGDALVLSLAGAGDCGWGTAAGDTWSGVRWLVERTGTDSISLYQDMDNWPDHTPFEGKLQGLGFVAVYRQGDDGLAEVCQFREATLTGTFAEDFSSFAARETQIWGPPGNEMIVVRSWLVRRL